MKRITFLAIIAALFTINAAKAQVGVHVGLSIGTPAPYYHRPHRVVVVQQPVYNPEPVYYPTYYHYYNRPVYASRAAYYSPRRVVVVNHYHRVTYRRR